MTLICIAHCAARYSWLPCEGSGRGAEGSTAGGCCLIFAEPHCTALGTGLSRTESEFSISLNGQDLYILWWLSNTLHVRAQDTEYILNWLAGWRLAGHADGLVAHTPLYMLTSETHAKLQ
jgi:hypothetical protein